MQEAGAQKKSDIKMIAQIMTQVPEEYEVATQAIRIMPASERTIKTVQKIYVDLWGAKYKNKVQADGNGVALYVNANNNKKGKGNYKRFKGNCNYCGIQGHKVSECCKKKKAESQKGDKKEEQESDASKGSGGKDDNKKGSDTRYCYRCKQQGHIAKNCPNPKGGNADAFFVGMAYLAKDEDDNWEDLLNEEDEYHIERELALRTDTEIQAQRMTSQGNCLSLECELVQLSLGSREDHNSEENVSKHDNKQEEEQVDDEREQ